jgi:isopentenyl-diphosphate delta-isomerase
MDTDVILITEKNEPIGSMNKWEAHSANTPLHRGFSLFLFNEKGELLLQQRSEKKKTWPNVWSNSVCGHPQLQETPIDAAQRRLAFEIGITHAKITMILPTYRYRFEKDGIVENEICPVMVGISTDMPILNPDEVKAVRWIKWDNWLKEIQQNGKKYSQWCVEETILLQANEGFRLPIFQ